MRTFAGHMFDTPVLDELDHVLQLFAGIGIVGKDVQLTCCVN